MNILSLTWGFYLSSLLSAALSSAIIWLDIDQSFPIPTNLNKYVSLKRLIYGFAISNSMVSILLYFALVGNPAFGNMPYWLRGILLGIAYPALLQMKFTTISINQQEVPLGVEYFYKRLKNSVYKRINKKITHVQYEESKKYAKKYTLLKLAEEARFKIEHNALLNDKEKEERQDWLRKVLQDEKSTNDEKSLYVGGYILFEHYNGKK